MNKGTVKITIKNLILDEMEMYANKTLESPQDEYSHGANRALTRLLKKILEMENNNEL